MALPVFDDGLGEAELDEMMDNAQRATNFLKALAHEGRLLILCHLASGEKSV
ncbi:MAG: transcriptional regulator, partial [Pseudomonadota bacterium]